MSYYDRSLSVVHNFFLKRTIWTSGSDQDVVNIDKVYGRTDAAGRQITIFGSCELKKNSRISIESDVIVVVVT